MSNRVAVLMCFHKEDCISHLDTAIKSILNQSYTEFVLFILVNGSVSRDADELINSYSNQCNIRFIRSNSNIGLARAMNYLLDKHVVGNDFGYVARMDADDISISTRFSTQISFFEENFDVSVLGSDCIEIAADGSEIGYKKMSTDHANLFKNIIKRCPLNHPSVMIRASVFENGARYNPNLMNTQDYYLWVDLFCDGYIFANINEPLIQFRITEKFYKKRGRKKALNDVKGRIYAMNKLRAWSFKNIVMTFSLFVLRLSPQLVSKLAYRFLR